MSDTTHKKDCMMLSIAEHPHCTCGMKIKQLQEENKQLHFKLGRIFSKLGDMSAGKVPVILAVKQILEIGMEE